MKKIKTNLLIILISIIFSLYIIEAYLSHLAHSGSYLTKIKIYKKKTGKNYDTRSKIEIFNEKKKYEKIAISYLPKILINNNNYNLFPLSGISSTKTIHCNENGYYSIYTSDRYGFNNPDGRWDERNIEYILLGDSFVHGACVNPPNDISSVLRNISYKSVLNLGYTGNGALIEYSTLKQYFKEGTKNIIWFYSENDLKDLKNELNNKILLRYLNENLFTQNLISNQNYINDIIRKLTLEISTTEDSKFAKYIKENLRIDKKNLIIKYKVLKFIRLNYTKNFIKNYYKNFTSLNNPQNEKLPYDEFREIIKKANNLALKNNCKFYFVYLPGMNRYKLNYHDTSYKYVKKIVNDLNIPFIDIHTEVFEKEDNPLKLFPAWFETETHYPVETHYTVEGYKKVFNKILKKKKNLSFCKLDTLVEIYRYNSYNIKIQKSDFNFIKKLSKKYPLYIVTDGSPEVQKSKIKKLSLKRYFKKIYYTYSFGKSYAKPSLKCFKLIKKKEKADWRKIVYIADNPRKDFVNLNKKRAMTIRVLKGFNKNLKFSNNYEAKYFIKKLSDISNIINKI